MNINLSISVNGDHPAQIELSDFFGIPYGGRRKTILIGKVISGTVIENEEVVLTTLDGEQSITDQIREIQINKKTVRCATVGESVGIRLGKTKLRDLRKLNS